MSSQKGLSLIELLLVIVILAILLGVILAYFNPVRWQETTRTAHAKASLVNIGRAAQIYADQHGDYPADVVRDIPQEFIQFMGPGAWPDGAFPGSVYDWDNWENQTCWDGTTGDIQITLRQVNGYKGKTDYTLYYVLEGPGIPHCSVSTQKGECVNCTSRYP